MSHHWIAQGRSGHRCERCGIFRYRVKGKTVFALNGYRLKSGRHAKTPECLG